MNISAMNNSGMNPTQMTQQMNDRFHKADADQNGSLTKTEMSNALTAQGIDSSKMEKMFDRMDLDKNGEISKEEHESAIKAMQDRMEKFLSAGSANGSDGFDSVKTLLESLENDLETTDDKEKLHEALEKLKSADASRENLSESVSLLNTIVPPIDIRV